jgi:hypothetical protein
MLVLTLSFLGAACATFVASAVGAGAHRAPRPDLAERPVSHLSLSTASPGQRLTAVDRVKNIGHAVAPKSVTKFYLETKLAHDRHLIVTYWSAGARTVPVLRPGQSSRAVAHLKVPTRDQFGTPPDSGHYYVVACADGRGKVKESKEHNNCKLSSSTINVTSSGGGGGATGTFPHEASYPGLIGSGTLSFDSPNPNQVKFQVSFNNYVDHVEIWLPRNESLVDMSPPATYGCGTPTDGDPHTGSPPTAYGQSYDGVACEFKSPLPPNTTITGTMSVSPAPSAGMGGYLYGSIDADSQVGGPFAISGP